MRTSKNTFITNTVSKARMAAPGKEENKKRGLFATKHYLNALLTTLINSSEAMYIMRKCASVLGLKTYQVAKPVQAGILGFLILSVCSSL